MLLEIDYLFWFLLLTLPVLYQTLHGIVDKVLTSDFPSSNSTPSSNSSSSCRNALGSMSGKTSTLPER